MLFRRLGLDIHPRPASFFGVNKRHESSNQILSACQHNHNQECLVHFPDACMATGDCTRRWFCSCFRPPCKCSESAFPYRDSRDCIWGKPKLNRSPCCCPVVIFDIAIHIVCSRLRNTLRITHANRKLYVICLTKRSTIQEQARSERDIFHIGAGRTTEKRFNMDTQAQETIASISTRY